MESYSIHYNTEYGPNKKKTNGKLLMLLHVSCGNNRDLFVEVIPSKPKTFVLTQNICHFEIHPDETPETIPVCIYWKWMHLRENSL